jgi:hypothetical protein
MPLPGEAPGISEGPARKNPYRIEVTQQTELPILNVQTRAPTLEEARALAAATPRAMSSQIEAIQNEQETPDGKRVVLRRLGPAQTGVVDNSAGKKIAIGAFVFLMAVFLTLIVGMPRFVRAWKAADIDSPADGGGAGAEVPKPEPEPTEPRKRPRKRGRKGAAKSKPTQKPKAAEKPKADAVPVMAAVTEAVVGEAESNGNGHAKDPVHD